MYKRILCVQLLIRIIYKVLLLLFLIVFNSVFVFSKENKTDANNPITIEHSCLDQLNEIAYIHLSRNSIIAGDKLCFKAYLFNKNNKTGANSKILYLQIIDPKGNIKANARAAINNKTCQSSLTIPDSLSSGLYKIVAFTNFMRNMPASTFVGTYIYIIGQKYEPEFVTQDDQPEIPGDKLYTDVPDTLVPKQFPIKEINKDNLRVTLNKYAFRNREKAILSLCLVGNNSNVLKGNFSISVCEKLPGALAIQQPNIVSTIKSHIKNPTTKNDSELIQFGNLMKSKQAYEKWYNNSKPDEIHVLKFKPENVRFFLDGIITDKLSQEPLSGVKILLSSPDSLANLKYCFSDITGRFSFPLDRSLDNRRLFVSAYFEKVPKEYNLQFDNKLVSDSSFIFEPLKSNNTTIAYFNKCKKLALFEKVFKEEIVNNDVKLSQNTGFRFHGRLSYTVYMSDYLVEFEDFNDICKNVLPGVRYRKKGNKKSIRMIDMNLQKTWPENCLVLLNNVPFYDLDYIASLGSKQINYIEVNYRHVDYGDLDFYGVLAIFTKDKLVISNGRSVVFENKVEAENSVIKKLNPGFNTSKKPNFKQLLYWNSNITLNKNETNNIEFYTSDLISDYIIDIEGITDDGVPVSSKIEFKVQ